MTGKILIACIGNIFFGDDGFGVEFAHRLSLRELPQQVCVKDFGIRGFDLACTLIEPWALVIIVDAMTRGGQAGSIYVLELGDDCSPPADLMDAHGLHPARALDLARAMGKVTARLLVVGVEPAELGGEDGHMGLSPPVESAVEPACSTIERIVSEFIAVHDIKQGVTV